MDELRLLDKTFQGEEKTYEDLAEVVKEKPEMQEEGEWQAQENVLKPGKRKGRSRRDAVEMMKGFKSVKKLIQDKFQKRRMPRRKVKKAQKNISEKDEEIMRQARRELEEFEARGEE